MNNVRTVARPLVAGSAAFLFASPIGPRIPLDNPENLGSAVMERLTANHNETKGLFGRTNDRIGRAETTLGEVKAQLQEFDARLSDTEQKGARRGGVGGGPAVLKSWGQRFTESQEFKGAPGLFGSQGNRLKVMVASTEAEHKNITSVVGSGAALVPVDRRIENPAMLPWMRTTVRDLVAPGTTTSNAVAMPRQVSRTNNAAPVAEGATKPQSEFDMEEVIYPVRTIAHIFVATRQIMDDAPALASLIDREARGGLADVEDAQMLFGDGTGQNLKGLVPSATPFVKQWTQKSPTAFDVLLQAIAQAEAGEWQVDGMVLNSVDWRMMQAIKNDQGNYIGSGPYSAGDIERIWNTPMVATNRMPRGKFIVGPFRTQAQIFDRMGVEVLASSEHADFFARNLIAVRAEERLAFSIVRPASFVTGDLSTPLTA